MQHIKVILLFLLFAFLTTGSIAQNNQPNVAKHSHSEYEESLEEMKDIVKKADRTYEQAQETYTFTKDLVEKKKAVDDRFFSWLSFFGTVIFAGVVAATIAATKSLKLFYQSKLEEKYRLLEEKNLENYKLLAEKNFETIQKIIKDEEWRNRAKVNKKVLVLNKKDTGLTDDFKKVIPTFANYKMADLENLEDSLSLDYSGYDLLIIENADDSGYWKLLPEKGKENDQKEKDEVANVKDIFKQLGNIVCPKTALIYYGKQGRGNFPSEEVDSDKRHMISYANTPSTLFGNMIDLLKFKAIIEDQQKY